MPWTTVNGKRKFIMPPDPMALPLGIEENTEEAKAWLFERRHLFHPWWKRVIAEWYEFDKDCRRKACRRAGACRSATLPCYDAALPYLREHVYPELRRHAQGRLTTPPAET